MVALSAALAWCACAEALNPSLDISEYGHTAWTVRDGFALGNIYCIHKAGMGIYGSARSSACFASTAYTAAPGNRPQGSKFLAMPSTACSSHATVLSGLALSPAYSL
jgi:hypothetical protein